eukprot:gnl/TRDRNA2_/TRDRNA2_50403_c0_seq1.p1 gnl/TRDRNA2_/TRDRNA2_50403_c0~~gnl/TRDRNA2_/TRDRNA2_50403_c0_seq1.p1  ORF type:complete len:384 (+),score=42.98 gnl/TRDRNA2_/TRDRNA2_50403_c0_seq1:46-1197(+)
MAAPKVSPHWPPSATMLTGVGEATAGGSESDGFFVSGLWGDHKATPKSASMEDVLLIAGDIMAKPSSSPSAGIKPSSSPAAGISARQVPVAREHAHKAASAAAASVAVAAPPGAVTTISGLLATSVESSLSRLSQPTPVRSSVRKVTSPVSVPKHSLSTSAPSPMPKSSPIDAPAAVKTLSDMLAAAHIASSPAPDACPVGSPRGSPYAFTPTASRVRASPVGSAGRVGTTHASPPASQFVSRRKRKGSCDCGRRHVQKRTCGQNLLPRVLTAQRDLAELLPVTARATMLAEEIASRECVKVAEVPRPKRRAPVPVCVPVLNGKCLCNRRHSTKRSCSVRLSRYLDALSYQISSRQKSGKSPSCNEVITVIGSPSPKRVRRSP